MGREVSPHFMNKKLTTEEFIKKAKLVHGNKYDYSLTNYISAKDKVKIICPIHGVFEQKASSHLEGRGCSYCCGGRKYSNSEFIEKAKKIFPQYDYSITKYNGSNKLVKIICPEHGEFERQAGQLLIGKGCGKCGRIISGLKHRNNLEELNRKYFINHETEYYEPIFTDNSSRDKLMVFCNICGHPFNILTGNFLSGRGCKNCMKLIFANNRIFSKNEFIEKSKLIHGNMYDYTSVNYKGKDTKVKIKCRECGNYFLQTPDAHWKGGGCPYCRGSAGERRIGFYLKDYGISYIPQKTFPDCRDRSLLSYDFYLPENNLLIEYNGEQHYDKNAFGKSRKEFLIQKHHDWLKRKYAKNNNYNFLVISYLDYTNIENILKNFINIKFPQS